MRTFDFFFLKEKKNQKGRAPRLTNSDLAVKVLSALSVAGNKMSSACKNNSLKKNTHFIFSFL